MPPAANVNTSIQSNKDTTSKENSHNKATNLAIDDYNYNNTNDNTPVNLLQRNYSRSYSSNISPSITTSRTDKTHASGDVNNFGEKSPDNLLNKIETNARSSDSYINENNSFLDTETSTHNDNIATVDKSNIKKQESVTPHVLLPMGKQNYKLKPNMQSSISKITPSDINLQASDSHHQYDHPNSNGINIYNVYRHNPNTIPPYVIDRLSHVSRENGGVSKFTSMGKLGDPFTATFLDGQNNVNWGEFLHTVKAAQSNFPVKTTMNIIDHGYETGKISDKYVYDDGEIRPYSPELGVLDNESSKRKNGNAADDIYRSYDFHSHWKGGNRLKGLFESPDIYSDQTDDEYDGYSLDSTSDDNVAGNGNGTDDVDLEKGRSGENKGRHRRKLKQFSIYRRDRERDIRERAKYWIEENKKDWKPKLFESIRTNSYFPLFFRLISLTLSSVALGLSARIVRATEHFDISQQPSPLMAMIVQSVSILYLFYITYDEFTSQPLGLRNPRAKIRLIMLDLIFIIFSSANLALSFQSLFDSRWVCTVSNADVAPNSMDAIFDSSLCHKVKALTAFLFLTLVVWCINFSISVFRVVHLVSYRDK